MSAYTDDAYKILGISPDATEKEIKTAYRKLALIHHPDRQTDPKQRDIATTNFVKIANAYEVLTDEYLRAEYNERRRNTVKENKNVTDNKNTTTAMSTVSTNITKTNNNAKSPTKNPTGTTRNIFKAAPKTKPSDNNDTYNEPFRYHFSDPYEVFKRDFREQFGIDYPGAKYDWIDFNEPIVAPATSHNNNNNNNLTMITNGTDDSSKKRGFNPFRRNKNNTSEQTTNNGQLVVANGKDSSLSSYNNTCTDIVLVEKRNNRPISMDVQTSKVGTVTTTKTTIVRPDGSTETMTMRTGIPGKAKASTNVPPTSSSVPRLTNGNGTKLITNGTPIKALPPSTTTKTSNTNNKVRTNTKLLTTSNNNNYNALVKSFEPKSKAMVGWGGKQ
jgi:curved DNA-binding protein CbpA